MLSSILYTPGNSHPNAHVENCGDADSPPTDPNDFPLDDADPVVDIYCGILTGSYDPNDKTGFPKGQTENNYISANQQLQYLIRFQNTGTDTAFTVVIRDTLDVDFDIFSVVSGVSSHSYEFKMYGPRVWNGHSMTSIFPIVLQIKREVMAL